MVIVDNVRVFDSLLGVVSDMRAIVIDGERIVDVLPSAPDIVGATRIDGGNRIAIPGLIDCHVHVTAIDHDVFRIGFAPPSYITAHSKNILEGMLARGFTTVRDAAGADFGLRDALAQGLLQGPRLFISGHPLSQTGGHGDTRKAGQQELICTCAGLGLFGAIADGDAQVRKAVREQLRNGANQIKVMAGGGIASPSDPIDGTQYSLAELTAIVEEVNAANTYAMAHAYSPRAITRAVQAGIRTIEHGNLLDGPTAKVMRECAAYLVPTLVTYHAFLNDDGGKNLPAPIKAKLGSVGTQGIEAVRIAKAEGVPIAFGSDLLGKYHPLQSEEFRLRAAAMTPTEILQSATSVGARVLQQEGQVGVIAKGALADVLLVDGDPTRDIDVLARPDLHLKFIMQGGRVVSERLA
jgi:imidazolonepropionase-like amidohydrolase